jgi:hypothetical protein
MHEALSYLAVTEVVALHTRVELVRQRFDGLHTSAYVSICQHMSAYVSIRQHTSAYVSIRQHTSAYALQLRCVLRVELVRQLFDALQRSVSIFFVLLYQ